MGKNLENDIQELDYDLELEEAMDKEKHNKKTIKSADAPAEDEDHLKEMKKYKKEAKHDDDDHDEEELEEAYTSKSELMSKMVAYASKMHKDDLAQTVDRIIHSAEEIAAKNDAATDTPDMSQKNKASIKSANAPAMKEDVEALFGSEQLSEDFKERTYTLFEAAVQTRVDLLRVDLEEEYENKLAEAKEEFDNSLEEAVSEILSETEEKVNDYLSYAVTEWVEENRAELENNLRAELTESFLQGLKGLFEEHYVEIPDDKLDVVEGLAERVEELEAEINESTARNIELKNQLDEMEVQNIRNELAEGLTDTQKDKFYNLTESLEYSSADHFKKKAEYILETFKTNSTQSDTEEMLNEEIELQEDVVKTQVDPDMSAYINAVKRTIKK